MAPGKEYSVDIILPKGLTVKLPASGSSTDVTIPNALETSDALSVSTGRKT